LANKLEGKADPLVIVDGKEVLSINNLKPENIKSISVLKDASATSVYGEKGKNGVVIVETNSLKDVVNKSAEEITKIMKDAAIKVRTSANKLEGKADSPLFIVDGKEVLSINNLKQEDIKSVSVLKDASATSVYGEKGKNGVIIIETKKMEEL
jgi:TonB-dependent SusC/RagA subfamily outer membrane receptor